MSRADAKQITRVLGAGIADDAAAAAARLSERVEREQLADVAYATFDSPLGTGLVAATARGLVRVALPNEEPETAVERLAAELSPRVMELPGRLDDARRELDQYFEGRRREFDLELDWSLARPGFYSRVLHETAKLPFGATASYAEIAGRAGNPRAYRAAGTALGSNPIPIVVPCHRIVLAGGRLGNYGGGPRMKEFLLRLEGAIELDE
jgi:methylated-DNA-[protein]-cysteine S-methyltransferase